MTHAQYITYFEDLAREHYLILHESCDRKTFFRVDIDELLEGLPGKSIAYPLMALESFTGKYDAQNDFYDNILERRTCAFSILYKVKQNDYDDQNIKLDLALQVGKDVIARILYDFKLKAKWDDGTLKVAVFNPSSLFFQKVGPLTDNEYGYRFQFDLINPERINLSYDVNKWIDPDDVSCVLRFGLNPGYCADVSAILLVPPFPGGAFSGPGVLPSGPDWYFDPGTAGVGSHTITWTKGAIIQQVSVAVNAIPVPTLELFAPVRYDTPPFTLTGGSPAGGSWFYELFDLILHPIPNGLFDPSIFAANSPLTTNMNIHYVYTNPSGCGAEAIQIMSVMAEAPAQDDARKTIQTRFAINLTHTQQPADMSYLAIPAVISACQQLNFQGYYLGNVSPPSVLGSNPNVARINTFLALMPNAPQLMLFSSVRWPDSDFNWLFATFDNVEAIVYEQESQNEVFDPSYSAFVNLRKDLVHGLDPDVEGIIDDALVYRFSTAANARRADVQNIDDLTIGRQYDQPSPDIIHFSGDYDSNPETSNVAKIRNYYAIIRRAFLDDFVSQYPLQQFEAMLQYNAINSGTSPDFVSHTAFENLMIGLELEFILANTNRYWYWAFMSLPAVTGNPRFYSLKRVSPLTRYKYAQPWDFGIPGVTGVLCSNDDGTCMMLINNSNNIEHHYSGSSISGLQGTIDLDIGWSGTNWAVAATNLTLTGQTDITIKARSVTTAVFTINT